MLPLVRPGWEPRFTTVADSTFVAVVGTGMQSFGRSLCFGELVIGRLRGAQLLLVVGHRF